MSGTLLPPRQYAMSQKQDTLLLSMTSRNVDRFSKFFTIGLSSKRVMKQK